MTKLIQTINDMAGVWSLVGASHSTGDVALPHFELQAAISQQLSLHSDGRDVDEAEGLTLSITADGRFHEEGDTAITWFDHDGVLEIHAVPFRGRIFRDRFLRADDAPEYSVPPIRDTGAILRYDDGDTKVSDQLLWFKAMQSGENKGPERLVRTMSAVTDEAYLDKVVLVYFRNE